MQLADTADRVAMNLPGLSQRMAEIALELLGEKSVGAKEPETFITRLAAERDRTVSDLGKLTAFLASDGASKLTHEAASDLRLQEGIMTELAFILSKRYDDLTLEA